MSAGPTKSWGGGDAPLLSYKIRFERSGDGKPTGTFSGVGLVENVSFPSIQREMVEVTNMSSPDGYREFIAGLRDPGEMSVDILYSPKTPAAKAILAELNSDATGCYRIVFPAPDNTVWRFFGIASGLEVNGSLGEKLTATLTIRLIGKPEFLS